MWSITGVAWLRVRSLATIFDFSRLLRVGIGFRSERGSLSSGVETIDVALAVRQRV